MKGNFLKKIFVSTATLGLSVMLAIGIAPVKAFAEETTPDYAAKGDDYYTYVQKFDDIAKVNEDFNGYYRENALGSAKSESVSTSATAEDSHWYMADGVLSRINGVGPDEDTGSYETNRVAILTFTKEAYLNFEMSIDVKAGPLGFWPVIGIRQIEEGKYYLDDGAGVFVQSSGTVTLWGDPAVGGPHEKSGLAGYNATQWHNWQIRVLGNVLSVSVDNTPWVDFTMSDNFYEAGFVSLISTNNACQYKNFRIKALAEPVEEEKGEFLPEAEADSDDALSKLAGEVKNEELFEREGKVNPDFETRTEWQDVVVEVPAEGGCSSSVAIGTLGVILTTAVFLTVRKKQD